jgi:hypothetical protein
MRDRSSPNERRTCYEESFGTTRVFVPAVDVRDTSSALATKLRRSTEHCSRVKGLVLVALLQDIAPPVVALIFPTDLRTTHCAIDVSLVQDIAPPVVALIFPTDLRTTHCAIDVSLVQDIAPPVVALIFPTDLRTTHCAVDVSLVQDIAPVVALIFPTDLRTTHCAVDVSWTPTINGKKSLQPHRRSFRQ